MTCRSYRNIVQVVFAYLTFVLNEQIYLPENGPGQSLGGYSLPPGFSSSMPRPKEREAEPSLLGRKLGNLFNILVFPYPSSIPSPALNLSFHLTLNQTRTCRSFLHFILVGCWRQEKESALPPYSGSPIFGGGDSV